jgi:hypothetical protein
MAFLADSYRLAFESFQLSDLRRYHQNEKFRYPPRQWTTAPRRSLYEVLLDRIDRLLREARRPGSQKNVDKLEALQGYALQLGELPNRSAYDTAIDLLRQQPGTDRATLDALRSVVHQSYFIYNGSLSCNRILLTEKDPDLVLTYYEDSLVTYFQDGDIDLIRRQRWLPGAEDEAIGWSDLGERALISRELDLRDRKLTLERRRIEKERETNLRYQVRGDQLWLTDYTAALASGACIHVSPAEETDRDARMLEMTRPV